MQLINCFINILNFEAIYFVFVWTLFHHHLSECELRIIMLLLDVVNNVILYIGPYIDTT